MHKCFPYPNLLSPAHDEFWQLNFESAVIFKARVGGKKRLWGRSRRQRSLGATVAFPPVPWAAGNTLQTLQSAQAQVRTYVRQLFAEDIRVEGHQRA